MIVRLRDWYGSRSQREQRMLLLMTAIALPLLIWFLIVRPLSNAYDSALDRHLAAVDLNGRVRALAAGKIGRPIVNVGAPNSDIALIIAERAAQSGLVLDTNTAAGPNDVSISIAAAPTIAATQWLAQLERDGFAINDLRMTPTPDGNVAVSARLVRRPR